MGKKGKKAKKTKVRKTYPTNVEGRAKEATSIQPPDKNEHKMDNENNIDKFLRYRPKLKQRYDSIKDEARHKNK